MRRSLLTLAALALLATLCAAGAVAAEPDPLAAVTAPQPALSTPPGCGAPDPQAEIFAPVGVPAPTAAALPCGSCSQPACRGVGACPSGYTCQWVYGNTCSDGGRDCRCWRGPLP